MTKNQLKELAKELTIREGKGVLKFSVIDNGFGMGIRVRRVKKDGRQLKARGVIGWSGLLQQNRTDEKFVAELLIAVKEVFENWGE